MTKHYFQIQGIALGTSYNIVYEAKDGLDLQNEVEAMLTAYELSLSVYNPDSIISKINRDETDEVDDYFKIVFERAKIISHETKGLFDISAEPLFREWGFSFIEHATISETNIKELMEYVGMDKIWIEGNKLFKANENIELNVNAIAKGYSTDIVANLLDSKKVTNYLVEIGGEIRASGISPKGTVWTVGIDKPSDTNTIPGQEIQLTLQLSDRALATSGNYRQFYVKDGRKIGHTINPNTGYPIDHSLLSVTVVANDAMSADAYSTAFLVAGIDATLALLEEIKDVEVLFICHEEGEYKVHYTEGLEQYILQ